MNIKQLNNVPQIGYGITSAVCYIGAIQTLMKYINDPIDEEELFALSGVGLCFAWNYKTSCDEVALIPDIPHKTFEYLGYESQFLDIYIINDKNDCFRRIKESIDKGIPVVGIGMVTKDPKSCIIVGYDDNGVYLRSYASINKNDDNVDGYIYSQDWHENCYGLLFIGKKIGEKYKGEKAYNLIIDWSRHFRWERWDKGFINPVKSNINNEEIFIDSLAFNKMKEWLKDDGIWVNPNEGNKEQYLKQSGILLLGHYRYQLGKYLKKLDAEYPNLVNKAVFEALDRIANFIPGSHTSDLWLHEVVDSSLKDFSMMKDKALREKVVEYVQLCSVFDSSLQWTLFKVV